MADLNTADIRGYLTTTYSDEEISILCSDYFRNVYNDFTTGMTKGQKVQLLVDHCQRRGLIPNLLAALEKDRPEQYQRQFGSIAVGRGRVLAPRERDPKQVFISHAHEDAAFAHRLAADLRSRGWLPWIAPDSILPGEKWAAAINRALEECGVFVLVLTPAAAHSDWVSTETSSAIELQHQRKIRFIPLEVAHCHVPPLWDAYQRVPFAGGYEDGLAALLTLMGTRQTPPVPPITRPRWLWPAVGGMVGLLAVIIYASSQIGFGAGKPTLAPTAAPVATLTMLAAPVATLTPLTSPVPTLTPPATPAATEAPAAPLPTPTPAPTATATRLLTAVPDRPSPAPTATPVSTELSVDGFENYSTPYLQEYFKINTNAGNNLRLYFVGAPHIRQGSQALAFDYDIKNAPPKQYVGFDRILPRQDWSRYDKLCLWIESDGSNRNLVIQFGENNNHFAKFNFPLAAAGGRYYCVAVHQDPSLNLMGIEYYGIYVEGPPQGSGVIYIDDVRVGS
jgi:hypothetical protein